VREQAGIGKVVRQRVKYDRSPPATAGGTDLMTEANKSGNMES
jgi:hypothetical protein